MMLKYYCLFYNSAQLYTHASTSMYNNSLSFILQLVPTLPTG